MANIGLCKKAINEGTTQFWSCAQGRIIMVFNNVARTKAEPVPDYLLPNHVIKTNIRMFFAAFPH